MGKIREVGMQIKKSSSTIMSLLGGLLLLSVCVNSTNVMGSVASEIKSGGALQVDKGNSDSLVNLVNFDQPEHQSWLKVSNARAELVSVSTMSGAKNDRALNIRFSPEANTSSVRVQPEKPWSLAELTDYNLAFEVKNLENRSTQIYLAIENAEGKSENRSVSLPANYSGTLFFPLSGPKAENKAGFWGDASPWGTDEKMMIWRSWRSNFDVNVITALNFHTIGILQQRNIQVNNVRLRKNPDIDDDWLTGLVDKFGQNARTDMPLNVKSDSELREVADAELAELAKSRGMPDRSRFGGYVDGPKLDATGYFRVQKVDGKWWMVDPEGYLFFSHGPANVRMANLTTLTGIDFKDESVRDVSADEVTPEDSMGIIQVSDEVRKTRYTISETRHGMFKWLPDYNAPLAEHYSYRRSTHKGYVPHGETFSFYRANLERRYGQTGPESYVKKWEEVTLDRMRDWGFTSFGNWVDPAFYPNEKVAYFANGWIIGDYQTLSGHVNHWGDMPDPFDPVFAQRAKATIDAIAADVKGSPWCAGIFIDNEKSWGAREGSVPERYGVILDALSKNSHKSPAKQAFTLYLMERYQSIDALNSAWFGGNELSSWAEFSSGVTFDYFTPAQTADLSKMLEMLGEQYFNVVHNALEDVLPNHLYMGARMANWGMPDEIIKASLAYSDVLSFNIYEEGMAANRWDFLEELDLPVVIGEFHIGATQGSGLFHPGIVHAADQADRAEMYKEYMKSVLSKPYMVGAHWFQYVDEPITGRAFDGENANIGFVTVADIPYPHMVSAIKDVTTTLYSSRYSDEAQSEKED